MLWDIIGVNYYVKKRSKENNWRTIGAVEAAGICAHPASLEVYHRGEAAGRAAAASIHRNPGGLGELVCALGRKLQGSGVKLDRSQALGYYKI